MPKYSDYFKRNCNCYSAKVCKLYLRYLKQFYKLQNIFTVRLNYLCLSLYHYYTIMSIKIRQEY